MTARGGGRNFSEKSERKMKNRLPSTPKQNSFSYSSGFDIEDGNKKTSGALLSKISDLQQKNADLESINGTLKYQIEVMKNRLKRMDGESAADLSSVDDAFDTTSSSSFHAGLIDRSLWLTGLLVFQSCSSFILQANEAMINEHPAVIFFLTMLVGAGGNAGNQAAVRAIRYIAVGSLNVKTRWSFVMREFYMALSLSGMEQTFALSIPHHHSHSLTTSCSSLNQKLY